jgi:hypothetical protein
MQINYENKLVGDAFDIIAQTNRGLYDKMVHTDWPVNVVTNDNVNQLVMEFASRLGPEIARQLVTEMRFANALTAEAYETWLLLPNIEDDATKHGYDLAKYAAQIIVHEFTHRLGSAEKDAYVNGALFAQQLGETRMANSQLTTLESIPLEQW